MIVVDTNVISSLVGNESAARRWLIAQEVNELRLSATSITEIVYGIHRLPEGRRKQTLLTEWAEIEALWSGRTFSITNDVAHMAGVVQAMRETSGHPIALPDAQIAATAIVHRTAVATRNTKDFSGLGIELIDPWAA